MTPSTHAISRKASIHAYRLRSTTMRVSKWLFIVMLVMFTCIACVTASGDAVDSYTDAPYDTESDETETESNNSDSKLSANQSTFNNYYKSLRVNNDTPSKPTTLLISNAKTIPTASQQHPSFTRTKTTKAKTGKEIFRQALQRAMGGGIPGAIAGAVQVLSLMWLVSHFLRS